MYTPDEIAWEVLNALADDWEDLEQIYSMVCFDFSSEGYEARGDGAYYLRPTKGAPMLRDLAERVCELAEAGLLEVRLDKAPVANLLDRTYVWRGWFRMNPAGRKAWEESPYAALAESGT